MKSQVDISNLCDKTVKKNSRLYNMAYDMPGI